ncbi:MAG: prolyl oligopeptidase family serine peptidase [Lachnospiraceae bacterium]|nr:prolyl oligopeptidase family serine peptidase [Lachnospiraceae bacterium]
MKMILPPNWDEADKDNGRLVKKFGKYTYKSKSAELLYRMYIPEDNTLALLPLVIYLHGADAAGDDNELQLSMHDIGTCRVKENAQKEHPCYILAPQYGEMKHWTMKEIKSALWELIDYISERYGNIDKGRIYIYGYSAGGVGVLKLIKERPDFFAAAISICAATGGTQMDNIRSTHLWMVHAEDDTIVKASYKNTMGSMGYLGSRDIYDKYGKEGDGTGELRYTEYAKGYMMEKYGVHPHCSWVAVSDPLNTQIWEWLFSKRIGE